MRLRVTGSERDPADHATVKPRRSMAHAAWTIEHVSTLVSHSRLGMVKTYLVLCWASKRRKIEGARVIPVACPAGQRQR